MSFTDQKPFAATPERVASLNKYGRVWQCALCGHKFAAGDVARWVYANGTRDMATGNFFVCHPPAVLNYRPDLWDTQLRSLGLSN